MRNNRVFIIILTFALLLLTIPLFTATHASKSHEVVNSKVINQAAIAWLTKNYENYYDLRNVDAEIIETVDKDSVIQYTVMIECETLLKYKTATDLPFVKGLSAALYKDGLTATKQYALDNFVKGVDGIGEWSWLTIEVVVTTEKEKPDSPQVTHYINGMERTLNPIDVLKLDDDEMYNSGFSYADEAVKTISRKDVGGYAGYNRIGARDYALDYVINAIACYDDAEACGIYQYRPAWNNVMYPYFSLFKHNDCANFVSQAMSVGGGLPENTSGSGWFRTKYSSGQNWSAAWTAVSSQKNWMTNSSHKYWDTSTFAACNAGNILHTSSSHVTMITLNDTVTHRFTAHTNDRKNYVFYSGDVYSLYAIKTT